MSDRAPNLEHLQRIKAAKQAVWQERRGNEKGLYLLFTGMGKGKTSSAMNLAYRHLAHNLPVAIVQFVKNSEAYPDGDRLMLSKLQELGLPVTISTLGGGFTWETQDPNRDREMAAAAWEKAAAAIADPEISLVILDELHIALHKGQLEVEKAIAGIQARPAHCHVASTGRRAPQALLEMADLVTEMTCIKHHAAQKIPAQLGIEY